MLSDTSRFSNGLRVRYMWQILLASSRASVSDRCPQSMAFAAGILLTLGGCSNLQALVDAPTRLLGLTEPAQSAAAPHVAFQSMNLASAQRPGDVQTLTAKGDALYAIGQLDLARTAYRAAVAIDPSALDAQIGLARTLVQSDPEAAETAFLSGLKHDPDNVSALNDLGVIWDLQGRHDEAQKAYRHALTISPNSIDIQVNLARSLALSGHTGDARELLHAIAADAAAQQWRPQLAAALRLVGDTQSAERLVAVGQLNPGHTGASSPIAEQFADASGAGSESPSTKGTPVSLGGTRTDVADLPSTPPKPISAPRNAATQAKLPPISPPGEDMDPRVDPPPSDGSRYAPSGSNPKVDAIATVSEGTESLPALMSTEPGSANIQAKKQVPASTAGNGSVDGPYVQLASVLSESDAAFEWDRLDKRFSDLLSAHDPTITIADVYGRTYWRLRTFGFAYMAEAKDLCARLMHAGLHCFSGREP